MSLTSDAALRRMGLLIQTMSLMLVINTTLMSLLKVGDEEQKIDGELRAEVLVPDQD